MADFVNNAFWYTVWDAKTGDLLASGTAAMCARRLGYASANSFAASVCHWLKDGRQHVKYICQRELIPRSEVDSLPRKPKRPAGVGAPTSPRDDGFSTHHHPDDITSERILQMKGILIEPGKSPEVTSLPDTLQGIEARLQCPCEQKVLPRTPAVLVFGVLGKGLNRIYRGQNIYGPILCYGWRNNTLQPLSKDLQSEMLDRLKDTEVRV